MLVGYVTVGFVMKWKNEMNNADDFPALEIVFRCIRYFDSVKYGTEPFDKDKVGIVVEMAKDAFDEMGKDLINERHTKSS